MAVTKIINSEEKQYKPVLVDKLVLDTVPTVGSFNGVTSDGVAQAISGSGNVPTPAAGDNGKVLTADNGAFGWSDPTGGTAYTAGTGITISDENAISITETIRNGAAAGATAVQPHDLASVATTGDYDDLSNKPTIPAAQVNADWEANSGVAQILNKPTFAAVATSGSYSDLSNKPNIPAAQVNADWNAESGVAAILNKPNMSNYAEKANLATVATSGSYADLSSKPTIPAAQVQSNWAETDSTSKAYIQNKPDMTAYAQTANLATVATTGSYSDLSNKPYIPAAQVNSDWNAVSGVAQILNKPTIPTVDQNYNAASTNAQSGVAVAQAIAAIPSASYTAGDGIDITSNEVSVNTGTGLSFESAVTSTNLSAPPAQTGGSTNGHSLLGNLNADIVAALKAGQVTVKPLFAFKVNIANGGVHFAICEKNSYNKPFNNGNWLVASDAVSSDTSGTYTMTVGDSYTADFSTLDNKSTSTWSAVEANPTNYYLQLISYNTSYSLRDLVNCASVNIGPTVPTEDVVTCEVADASAPKMLAVSDPIPSHSSTDENKVLTVNSSGNAVWATPATVTVDQTYSAVSTNAQSGVAVAQAVAGISVDEVPAVGSSDDGKVLTASYSGGSGSYAWASAQGATYTAGNMIAINQNAIGVSTTAGITDIQQVNALPANPVSTVLYLIPEA